MDMTGILGDLRHGMRQLTQARGFSVPAVAGLALGIAATTAVFSIVHATLLRSSGVTDAGRVVALWETEPQRGQKQVEVCYADLQDWRKETGLFENVAIASSVNLDVPLFDGEPQQVDATTVSGAFFSLLGTKAAMGRLLTEEDDRPGAPLRLVISHRLWRTRYGADPNVVGRSVRTSGASGVIAGVLPPEFDFPRGVDVFFALEASWPDVAKQPYLRVFRAVARLRDGVPAETARTRLNMLASQSAQTRRAADAATSGVLVTPLIDEVYGPAKQGVSLLLAAVLLVLLIGCANTANLLMARATARNRELALRSVLGAQRGRVVLLLLAESAVLSGAAAAAGMGLARVLIRVIARFAPAEVPHIDEVALDAPVLLFGIGISFLTVLLFGLGPALAASRRDPNDALRPAGRGSAGDRGHTRTLRTLMATEVALSVVLLIGAALLIRSFTALASIDPGFNAQNILTFRVTTNSGAQDARRKLYGEVLESVRTMPGVISAGAVLIRPLSGLVGWDTTYTVEGQSPEAAKGNPNGNYEAISPDYFRTMGIRFLEGRDFRTADVEVAPGVVIINAGTARRHWPGRSAIGRRIRLNPDPKAPWLTVAGVVSDVRYREWQSAQPDFYVPYTQRAQHRTDFVVKTAGDPEALAEAVRRKVLAIDPQQPISNVTTMERLVDRAISGSRFVAMVLTLLSACALGLAAIGIYGVLSYAVALRTWEIGIRIALGSTPGQVLGLIAASGMRTAMYGAAAGIAAAIALVRVLSSLVYGVGLSDPAAWASAVCALFAAAMAACVVPARRAAKVDPARVLAAE
jgi:putative ABC transport system permease protein